MSQPFKMQLFRTGDLPLILMTVLALGLSVGALLTPQNTPWYGWFCLLLADAGLVGILIAVLLLRYRFLMRFKYVASTITVGWTKPEYQVADAAFESILEGFYELLMAKYPKASSACSGCYVLFCDPVWTDDWGRKVAGLQEDALLYVGWNQDLTKTALRHELMHRVLQVLTPGLNEDEQHHLMEQEYGL